MNSGSITKYNSLSGLICLVYIHKEVYIISSLLLCSSYRPLGYIKFVIPSPGLCIWYIDVCTSSIYIFWLPLWYLQTLYCP